MIAAKWHEKFEVRNNGDLAAINPHEMTIKSPLGYRGNYNRIKNSKKTEPV